MAETKTLNEFLELIRDSVDQQAKRKNYTEGDIDGENMLSEVGRLMKFEPAHGIGEIVYKCAEYLRNPREVLLVKIAGWAFILWRRHARPEASFSHHPINGHDREMTQEEYSKFITK